MAKVTIDGEVIEAAEGSLILEAAEKLGIPVPTFCYQERLTPLASCRMCLVEIEGQPKLAPACVTRVTEGMVVKTKTDLVEKTRESMLELLLANHPLDCPVCDKAGECELQDTVFAHGAGVSRFRDEKRVFRSRDIALNDVIIFNANRCIQCTRCVRFITEVAGVSEIGLASRGEDAEITTYLEKSLTSELSGNIIDLCPVGALTSKPYAFNAYGPISPKFTTLELNTYESHKYYFKQAKSMLIKPFQLGGMNKLLAESEYKYEVVHQHDVLSSTRTVFNFFVFLNNKVPEWIVACHSNNCSQAVTIKVSKQ